MKVHATICKSSIYARQIQIHHGRFGPVSFRRSAALTSIAMFAHWPRDIGSSFFVILRRPTELAKDPQTIVMHQTVIRLGVLAELLYFRYVRAF